MPPSFARCGDAPAGSDRPVRLFVSVGLNDAWRRYAGLVADVLRARHEHEYRWVRPELYHVTLAFLGNQSPARLPELRAALASAASKVRPFGLELGEFGSFGVDVPSMLLLRVRDPYASLRALRGHLDDELTRRDVPYDRKPLAPHVTLGRARQRGRVRRGRAGVGPARPAGRPMQPHPGADMVPPPALAVERIELVRSDLRPSGPVYEPLAHARLGA